MKWPAKTLKLAISTVMGGQKLSPQEEVPKI
jgi:hypothetical protein